MTNPKEEVFSRSTDSLKTWLDQLPEERFWDSLSLYQWEGFWYPAAHLQAARSIQSHFKARNEDVILASSMKTGTTWMKALLLCIMGPQVSNENEDPLVKNHPAFYVQTLESQTYLANHNPDLAGMPSPRLFHTHMAYSVLPDPIKTSKCKIVYIVRNPKDTLVSMWHFFNNFRTPEQGPFPLENAFESFCRGVHPHGPFFDHVLQYWEESLRAPQKILFLTYEELKRDPKMQVRKLASFLGRPFKSDEEVEKVLWRCSLERLKNLEVNKDEVDPWTGVPKSSFFRLGVVGDSKKTLSLEMQEQLDQMTKLRLDGSGLQLQM